MLRKALIATSFTGLFLAGLSVQADPGPKADFELPVVSIAGSWTAEYCWLEAGCGTDYLFIAQEKQAITFEGFKYDGGVVENYGAGVTTGSYTLFHYVTGCEPNVISTETTTTSMSGTMSCKAKDGDSGTWTAVRTTNDPRMSPRVPVRGEPTLAGRPTE